jgi:flagellar M-ring protein FliF
MQENIRKKMDFISEKWNALTLKQKMQIILISVILVVALGLTIYMTSRPKMVVVAKGLDSKTAYQLQTALETAKISSKIVQGETAVSVKEADYESAKRTSISSKVLGSDFTFPDALDAMGMGTTADVKKSIINYEKESRLASQLTGIDGVESATVNLNVPQEDNFFLESKQIATAAVKLKLKKDLTQDQVASVVNYVKASVKGLDKKNIEVIDDKLNILYSGDESANGSISSQYKMEVQKKSDIEKMAKQTLAPLYDDVKIMSNITLNWDKYAENSEKYATPIDGSAKGIPQQDSSKSSSYKNTATASEPGLSTNGGDVTQYATGNNTGSEAKSDQKDTIYAINKTQTNTEKQLGDVVLSKSSLAATVYKYKTYNQADVEKKGLLQDMTWKEFKEQVASNPLTIDQSLITLVSKGTGIDEKNLTIIGYEIPKFVDKVETPRPIDQYVALVILVLLIGLLAFALIRRTSPAEVTEIEPELSVEEVLETFNKKQEYVSPIDYEAESEVKKQIEKFVDERPEAVAQLLRNWLSSDWE